MVLKPVAPVLVRDHASAAAEIRVDGCEIGFLLMPIAAARIGLPEFEQRAWNRAGVLVENATIDDDPLADGVARSWRSYE